MRKILFPFILPSINVDVVFIGNGYIQIKLLTSLRVQNLQDMLLIRKKLTPGIVLQEVSLGKKSLVAMRIVKR